MDEKLAVGEITRRLQAYAAGDHSVEDRLVEDVYPVLRQYAQRVLKQRPEAPLVPTELANEAYLRIFHGAPVDWQDSAHFRAIAALTLRRILGGMARNRRRLKRGGEMPTVSLDHLELAKAASTQSKVDLLDLELALESLAEVDASAARIVALRFFGGLSMDEVAVCCDLSSATAGRRWRFARAWLRRNMQPRAAP